MEEKPIKLYLSILNEGWIRSEHINTVFLASNTKRVKLVLETLGLTWDKPIASNRNRIVQRFLKTDCDFLMMVDDDVVPFFNIAEMVFYNKDIVGAPTRRRKEERLEWVAYKKNPVGEGYYSVDLDRVDPNADLIKVDAIGTGCILIKRAVLEKVKCPFVDIFDDNGVRIRGMDLNFCDKAIEVGFEVFVSPKKICEHFRDVGLITLDAQFISHAQEEPQVKYGILWGDIIEKDWDFMKKIIQEEDVKTVLEFGTGLNTLLISEFASVDSYTTDSKQLEHIKSKIPKERNIHLSLWNGSGLNIEKRYDLAFINGPDGMPRKGLGKEVALKAALEHADRIIVRRAGFMYEMMLQEQFLRKDFFLVSRNGWHQSKCHFWRRKNDAEETGKETQSNGKEEVSRKQEAPR